MLRIYSTVGVDVKRNSMLEFLKYARVTIKGDGYLTDD